MRFVRSMTLVLVAVGSAGLVQAANPPQYNGVFEERDARTGAYTELERTQPAIHSRMLAMGFGGAKVTEDIAGPRSPVRFPAGTPLEFIVRESARDNDPNTLIQFVTLVSKGDQRYFETYSAGMGGMKNTASKSAVGFSASNFGDAYFRVSPNQALPPGEYALTIVGSPAAMMTGAPPAYCFGIDP